MTITLNGEPRSLDAAATVERLLSILGLQPVRVAVEINEELVPRRQFSQTTIRDGDRVEVVTFVGGG